MFLISLFSVHDSVDQAPHCVLYGALNTGNALILEAHAFPNARLCY